MISLKYQIFDPYNTGMTDRYFAMNDSEIDLSKTIAGFAHGVKGMRIGECREIYIHPSLAYGLETSLEKGIYLRAIVTLHEIQGGAEKKYPPLEPENLSIIIDPNFEKECEKKCVFLGRFYGKRVSEYLARSDIVDLPVVKKNLKELYKTSADQDLSEDEKRAINRIHWNIHFFERITFLELC